MYNAAQGNARFVLVMGVKACSSFVLGSIRYPILLETFYALLTPGHMIFVDAGFKNRLRELIGVPATLHSVRCF